jgi:hypothetical protein
VPFDLTVLSRRYHDELRVYLGNPDREDLTLKLWVEMISKKSEHRDISSISNNLHTKH